MKKRLPWALGCYAILFLLATFTLEGPFRLAIWVFLAGLTARTLIAVKRG
jgi:hypothetical protein